MVGELFVPHLLLLLGAAGLAVWPYVGQLPHALTAWLAVVFVWRLVDLRRPSPIAARVWRLVLSVAGIALLYRHAAAGWGMQMGMSVFVVALAIKLLELRQERDVYLLGYLIILLAGAHLLTRPDLASTAYGILLCGLVVSVWAAVNGAQPALMPALRRAVGLLAQALPMTVLLFVLFPRLEAPSWDFFRQDKEEAQSGLSDVLEPGKFNQLSRSPKLAFRAAFSGPLPPRNRLYWRGPAFSHTDDGRVWRQVDNDVAKFFQDRPSFRGPEYRYRLLLEPQKHNWVYALDMPARFERGIRRNANYQLLSGVKAGEAAQFEIVSRLSYNTGYITKTEYWQNLQLPGNAPPRVAELVKTLHGFEGKPEVFIEQVMAYFRREGFKYSLQPPLMDRHFIETFLFEARVGVCNHYAAAFAYLMRVAGIPARVITGYQGGEFNAVGGFLEVRQANAHAWNEVWLDGKGWVRVDPTTAILPERIEQDVDVAGQVATGVVSLVPQTASVDEQGVRGLIKVVMQIFDSVDYRWQSWIVGYGAQDQAALLARLGVAGFVKSWLALVAVLGLTLIALAAWMFRRRESRDDPEIKLYRRFCRKLAKSGIVIQPGEGPCDFALRAKAQRPEAGERIDGITEVFIKLRYRATSTDSDLRLLKKQVATFCSHRF